jgi:hypothetical protein
MLNFEPHLRLTLSEVLCHPFIVGPSAKIHEIFEQVARPKKLVKN